jgi:hypothetical protein
MYGYLETVTDMIRQLTCEENEKENKKPRTKDEWDSSDEEYDDILTPLPPPTILGFQLPYLQVTPPSVGLFHLPTHHPKKQYRTPETQTSFTKKWSAEQQLPSPIELPNALSPINHTIKPVNVQQNLAVVNLDAINRFIRVYKENGFYDATGNDYGWGQYVDVSQNASR